MARCMKPVVVLLLVLSWLAYAQEENADDLESENTVRIVLSKLEVDDAALSLHYTIENSLDHSVWVLQNIDLLFEQLQREVFMSKDGKTLLMRRRLDIPRTTTFGRGVWPWATYVLLQPNESLYETVSLKFPVETRGLFTGSGARFVGQATRLRLEIGYYDEDLPKLIRSILRGAESLGNSTFTEESEVKLKYFRGLRVHDWVGPLSGFDARNPAPYDDGVVVFMYSLQALTGEKVLATEVDGLSIPYDGTLECCPEHNSLKGNGDSTTDSDPDVGSRRNRG